MWVMREERGVDGECVSEGSGRGRAHLMRRGP
jgi:hypothetical protein